MPGRSTYPAILGDARFRLIATVDPGCDGLPGIPHYADLSTLREIDAVVICTPPQVRQGIARKSIERGWSVLLEKPPAASVEELASLAESAEARGLTPFAAWHSRFAAGVEPARRWLAGSTVGSVRITWCENVREWHPGQEWIWESGGFGVFDPGINALSIVTTLLPPPIRVERAELQIPENRAAPIAASILMSDVNGAMVSLDLDWRHEAAPVWDIVIDTERGPLMLSEGGSRLQAPGLSQEPDSREYERLYGHFGLLLEARRSDVDHRPLELALACMKGRVNPAAPFLS